MDKNPNIILTIYFIILSYFMLGGIGFYFINRRKEREVARNNQRKLISYFIIIHILFFSIVIYPPVFRCITALIIAAGLFELFKLYKQSSYQGTRFFLFSMILFAVLATGFYFFSGLQRNTMLFSFLTISVFDSFSQITGQLAGKKKLVPNISPNKTREGLIGGMAIAMLTAYLIKGLVDGPLPSVLVLAAGTVLFAFIGDIFTSYYKRHYQVKDFSRLIPGHGGFLDRFDSLIAGGFWTALFVYLGGI
ncbi:MAG: phosphatidate cytidylyltransferase [Bacteroidales bacterium]